MCRRPAELSGGQHPWITIGRAILHRPRPFLFDEPLSNLDAALRGETRIELARLHREPGATMLYITHDQVEAMTLANKIVVLNAGRIEQVGAPMTLYNDPANRFVAALIGAPAMKFLPAALTRLATQPEAWKRAYRPKICTLLKPGLPPASPMSSGWAMSWAMKRFYTQARVWSP